MSLVIKKYKKYNFIIASPEDQKETRPKPPGEASILACFSCSSSSACSSKYV